MTLKIAELKDIKDILELHKKYQIDGISNEDKKDGFITTNFTKEELTSLIIDEKGLFIAIKDNNIVGYIMSASWEYWKQWPMFVFMEKDLKNLSYLGKKLDTKNSYQYGPICIDKSVRGTGILEELFDFALESMSKRYDVLVTFVNKINERSFSAHKRKLGLDVIQEFEFNNNSYYEMVYDTSKRVLKKY